MELGYFIIIDVTLPINDVTELHDNLSFLYYTVRIFNAVCIHILDRCYNIVGESLCMT